MIRADAAVGAGGCLEGGSKPPLLSPTAVTPSNQPLSPPGISHWADSCVTAAVEEGERGEGKRGGAGAVTAAGANCHGDEGRGRCDAAINDARLHPEKGQLPGPSHASNRRFDSCRRAAARADGLSQRAADMTARRLAAAGVRRP